MACPVHDSLSKKTEMAAFRPSRTSDKVSAGVGLCLTTARLRLPKADADRFDRLEQERNYVTSIAPVKVKLDGRSSSDGAASSGRPCAGAGGQDGGEPPRVNDSTSTARQTHAANSLLIRKTADASF
jgi:hypothetical protein